MKNNQSSMNCILALVLTLSFSCSRPSTFEALIPQEPPVTPAGDSGGGNTAEPYVATGEELSGSFRAVGFGCATPDPRSPYSLEFQTVWGSASAGLDSRPFQKTVKVEYRARKIDCTVEYQGFLTNLSLSENRGVGTQRVRRVACSCVDLVDQRQVEGLCALYSDTVILPSDLDAEAFWSVGVVEFEFDSAQTYSSHITKGPSRALPTCNGQFPVFSWAKNQ